MENVPNILAMRNGHYRDEIISSFREAGYKRISVSTLLASNFGVPQDRRRVFFIGLRDDLRFEQDFSTICARLLTEYQSDRRVTVRQAISDLPAAVSANDEALPYPQRRRGRYADYQQLMRLDFDTPLLSEASKNARLNDGAALHNHHTKGIEARRLRIIEAIKPGRRGDFCQPICGTGRGPTSGGASTRGAPLTQSSRKCTAICPSGSIPSMIDGSRFAKRRGSNHSMTVLFFGGVNINS